MAFYYVFCDDFMIDFLGILNFCLFTLFVISSFCYFSCSKRCLFMLVSLRICLSLKLNNVLLLFFFCGFLFGIHPRILKRLILMHLLGIFSNIVFEISICSKIIEFLLIIHRPYDLSLLRLLIVKIFEPLVLII